MEILEKFNQVSTNFKNIIEEEFTKKFTYVRTIEDKENTIIIRKVGNTFCMLAKMELSIKDAGREPTHLDFWFVEYSTEPKNQEDIMELDSIVHSIETGNIEEIRPFLRNTILDILKK